MDRIRVLIVDDSVVACRVLADTVASDPELEVAGTALSGPLALRKLSLCSPDVVMLDIDMPEMDGIQTLGEIKKVKPDLPVIICSGLAEKGNSYTMKALLGGAADYVTKPKGVAQKTSGFDSFRKDLIGKIKAHSSTTLSGRGIREMPAEPPLPGTAYRTFREGIEALVIGVSTGGPKALAEVIPRFPADFPLPILIVQHMPMSFTKTLADNLKQHSRIGVEEAAAGMRLRPSTAYIAPGGLHMKVVRKLTEVEVVLTEDPPVNSCRPSVDVLFGSACAVYGPRLLGVVLTGMGQDGLAGADLIRKAGGHIYVQDEATSVVWGMPGAIAKAGLADRIVPLKEMADAVYNAILRSRLRTRRPSQPEGDMHAPQ